LWRQDHIALRRRALRTSGGAGDRLLPRGRPTQPLSTKLERNPWCDLPLSAPYVLPDDNAVLARDPRVTAALQLDLLPAPHQGWPDSAEVWLLTKNPGGKTKDFEFDQEFIRERRRSLTFKSDFPIFSLDSRWPAQAGYKYWTSRLRHLIKKVGIDHLARKLMIVQYFPYQSQDFPLLRELLPSQKYTFDLVRRASKQGKLMVVLRAERLWLEAVPELAERGYVMAHSPRSGHISPGNLGETVSARSCSGSLGHAPELRSRKPARHALTFHGAVHVERGVR
jgi:hypothetical protein